MAKKSMWYPASVKPVRDGWYEVKYDFFPDVYKTYWQCCTWRYSPDGNVAPVEWDGDKWRGLAAPQ